MSCRPIWDKGDGVSLPRHPTSAAYLNGKLPLGEVGLALLGLLQLSRGVLGGQTATDGTGLLGAEVERDVLLGLVEETELRPLLGVDDREDTCDRLAEVVAANSRQSLIPLSPMWLPVHDPGQHTSC